MNLNFLQKILKLKIIHLMKSAHSTYLLVHCNYKFDESKSFVIVIRIYKPTQFLISCTIQTKLHIEIDVCYRFVDFVFAIQKDIIHK